MERLKSLQEIMAPDSRTGAFVKFDEKTNEILPIQLEDYHRRLSDIALREQVPEDIRSYFETVKNICLYGWFVYSFFTVSTFLSYIAIEMSLRRRFQNDDPDRKWPFKRLLQEARDRCLISERGFLSIQAEREYHAKLAAELGSLFEQSVADYCSVLVDCLPQLRNSFAHPSSNTILTPGDALSSLTVAAEFINQLFHDPEASTGGIPET